MSLAERFHAKYIPEPNSGCWLWDAAVSTGGYGRIGDGSSKVLQAHRVAYEIHRGPIPPGLNVCHRCDVPLCVNPEHLFLGTQRENLDDMTRKGRASRAGLRVQIGERHSRSKVTADQVRAIRHAYDTGLSNQTELGATYGMTPAGIGYIVRRKHWRHV